MNFFLATKKNQERGEANQCLLLCLNHVDCVRMIKNILAVRLIFMVCPSLKIFQTLVFPAIHGIYQRRHNAWSRFVNFKLF